MAFLLDINVLIARVDSDHEFHQRACRFLSSHSGAELVTCPLTENGFLRIYGHPSYPGGPGSPGEALAELQVIRALARHRFLGDTVSIDDPGVFHSLDKVTPKQLTDVYLLGLAARHRLSFATFDHRIPTSLVIGGRKALEMIP
jgi:hypothetical protein